VISTSGLRESKMEGEKKFFGGYNITTILVDAILLVGAYNIGKYHEGRQERQVESIHTIYDVNEDGHKDVVIRYKGEDTPYIYLGQPDGKTYKSLDTALDEDSKNIKSRAENLTQKRSN
jgi:hypothetical protein